MNNNNLKKEVLIVGSNSALIRDSLNLFLKKGYNVVGISKRNKKLSFYKNKNYYHYNFDLIKNFNRIQGLCKKISNKHKNISIIIYAQGGSLGINKIFTKFSNWQKLWKLNFACTLIFNNFFIKKFIKKKYGRILYFTSVAANFKFGSPVYSSSKVCIQDYVKKMGNNFSNKNIFVNSINTSIVSDFGNNWNKFEIKSKKNRIIKLLSENLSTQKFGRSSYFTEMIDLLCSKRNKFITGANINMDGGFLR